MKTYKIEVDFTLTAYMEIEAENEEAAETQALEDARDMKVDDLKEWESSTSITEIREQCDECCGMFDVDIEPLIDYKGKRICSDCKQELEETDGTI